MDLLHDVLTQAGLRSRFLGLRKITRAMTLEFSCDKSLGFHVVTQGVAYMHIRGKQKPIELAAGDIVFTARGRNHLMSTEREVRGKILSLDDFDSGENSLANTFDESTTRSVASSSRALKSRLTLVSGAYQVWNEPVHPLFSELPDVFLLRSADNQSFDQMHSMIAMLSSESNSNQFGSERVLENTLDILFTLIFRKVLEKCSHQPETWSHAILDPHIRRSIELMHSDWAKNWTIESLAIELGLSRAGFAAKFKTAMGDTPVHYLTKLRMQKAMIMLSETDEKIEAIASRVGYKDAFGFSKSFKKMIGVPPKEFRAKDAAARRVLSGQNSQHR